MIHLFGMSLLDRINRLRRRQAHRRAKERFEKRLFQRLTGRITTASMSK
jgi:hypothetical protein